MTDSTCRYCGYPLHVAGSDDAPSDIWLAPGGDPECEGPGSNGVHAVDESGGEQVEDESPASTAYGITMTGVGPERALQCEPARGKALRIVLRTPAGLVCELPPCSRFEILHIDCDGEPLVPNMLPPAPLPAEIMAMARSIEPGGPGQLPQSGAGFLAARRDPDVHEGLREAINDLEVGLSCCPAPATCSAACLTMTHAQALAHIELLRAAVALLPRPA